ncbi:helix-turn-helix domain-containing protein [Microbulbifer variabilis]|uniref:helix-turn-helix domain-containing protein n=1 Tax=Microbulbifer variabilis TaxID=266805 RepID=UPI001CFD8812|nr:helix-turn-helix transcriptional regulator [Microbulbifer variabilis]
MTVNHYSELQQQRISIANRLRQARIKTKITGRNFASQIGVPPSTLSKMEKGQQTIPAELLLIWCKALSISTNEVLGLADLEWGPLVGYVDLFRKLSSQGRELVLGHLELVAKLEKKKR